MIFPKELYRAIQSDKTKMETFTAWNDDDLKKVPWEYVLFPSQVIFKVTRQRRVTSGDN